MLTMLNGFFFEDIPLKLSNWIHFGYVRVKIGWPSIKASPYIHKLAVNINRNHQNPVRTKTLHWDAMVQAFYPSAVFNGPRTSWLAQTVDICGHLKWKQICFRKFIFLMWGHPAVQKLHHIHNSFSFFLLSGSSWYSQQAPWRQKSSESCPAETRHSRHKHGGQNDPEWSDKAEDCCRWRAQCKEGQICPSYIKCWKRICC